MKTIRTIKNSRGFTLIELMITVAIVGILTAVALPAYQDYTIRSQISEGLSLVSGAKPVVGEYFSNHGTYPTNSDVGFTGYIGKFITKTEIGANGKIIATFGGEANSKITGQTVTLSPETDTNTGNIKWSCGSSANAKYLPTSCANDGSTGNPGNPGEGGNTEPPFDFWKNTSSYLDGTLIYNGDGTITLAGRSFTGTIINGEMVFDMKAMIGDSSTKIDKDGNFILKSIYENGLYNVERKHLPESGYSVLTTYNYSNIDGQSYSLDYIEISNELPSYYDNDLYNRWMDSANVFTTAAKNGTLPSDAVSNYNSARNEFVNNLKQQKANGVQLSTTDEAYLNKHK